MVFIWKDNGFNWFELTILKYIFKFYFLLEENSFKAQNDHLFVDLYLDIFVFAYFLFCLFTIDFIQKGLELSQLLLLFLAPD